MEYCSRPGYIQIPFQAGLSLCTAILHEKEFLVFGVTAADYGDCTMQIFDRDRLICECIFYENKIDRETYNKAIQSYVADTKKNVPKLLEYAEKRRVLKKVKDRIGVWL